MSVESASCRDASHSRLAVVYSGLRDGLDGHMRVSMDAAATNPHTAHGGDAVHEVQRAWFSAFRARGYLAAESLHSGISPGRLATSSPAALGFDTGAVRVGPRPAGATAGAAGTGLRNSPNSSGRRARRASAAA